MIARKVQTNALLKALLILLLGVAILSLTGCKEYFLGMLNPKGIIAYQERKLLFDTAALMLIVVIPVIIMSIAFIYHYQVSHHIRDYKPNWSNSHFLEAIWWGIPCVIILILGIITWKKTHELDPYNRIPSANPAEAPLLIKVVALPWKWLFIYPEQKIATVNYLELPLGRQVEFWFTNDNVPMSAFFIPQLGSQIYTMAGMRTRLHLLATHEGVFDGLNSQYNGDGFSDMHFAVRVVKPEVMQQWYQEVKKSPYKLTEANYKELTKPSNGDKVKYFTNADPLLFDNVMHLYMNTVGNAHPRSNDFELKKD